MERTGLNDMNAQEARTILAAKLAEYRAWPYARLAGRVGDEDHFEIAGPSGADYHVEIQFFWDDHPIQTVRVMGSVDDGGLRAFVPLCASFLLAPDGQFAGE